MDQHPPKIPPLEYLSPVTITGKEGNRSKSDAGSLKDKESTYQDLIPQQQPTDQGDYQSLTWHTLSQHKEYCNVPPPLPLKPETDSLNSLFTGCMRQLGTSILLL